MKQIFKKILEVINPIDIRQAIGKKDDNSNDSLKERHYLISVVDELLKVTVNLGYDFCAKNGFIYLFNGQYWQQIEDAELSGKSTQIDPLPPRETDPLRPFQIDPLIPAQIDPLKQ